MYPSFAWSDTFTDCNLTRLTWLIIVKILASLLLMDAALFETPAALLLMAPALFETPAALLLMAAALFETSVTMLLMAAS